MPLALPDQGTIRAKLAKRAYWRLRYTDGTIVSEWDCDWSLAPAHGRQALRLHCPNGQVAELGNSQDATGRLFQLHGATLRMGEGRRTDFQLIGIVENPDGDCAIAVWEYGRQRLLSLRDNVQRMRYASIGLLNHDALGLKF